MSAIETVPAKATITKRPAGSRGVTELGWLHSHHGFSFGSYFDPAHMGFRSLRVVNDDIVEPGGGFGMHPHQDAEIFSYVIEGELQHRDSLGNGSIIKAGNLQYLSAGDGVLHSEYNPSDKNRVHFLQIWLRPKQQGGEPVYAEKKLGKAAHPNALSLLFSGEDRPDAVRIRQDAEIYFGSLDANRSIQFAIDADRGVWIQVIQGELQVLDESLSPGDGAAISEATELTLYGASKCEFFAFVLP